jgi:hypothetical protein
MNLQTYVRIEINVLGVIKYAGLWKGNSKEDNRNWGCITMEKWQRHEASGRGRITMYNTKKWKLNVMAVMTKMHQGSGWYN